MAKVTVLAGNLDELIGEFEFVELPRKGEVISVPSATDPYGFRAFTVDEVTHVAVGITGGTLGDGPRTVLRYSDEIK